VTQPNTDFDVYDADYFLRGKETGKSLYTDYRWMPDLTIPMVKAIGVHLEMPRGSRVLDYGCARGYMVKAFNSVGYPAYGFDPSQWVIDHCDPEVAHCVTTDWADIESRKYDWVVAKDVLEHVPAEDLGDTIRRIKSVTEAGIFAVVPLAEEWGQTYVVPEYEADVTHRVRINLHDWMSLFVSVLGNGWTVTASYRVAGVKDNYYDKYPTGNGFITARMV